MLVLVCVVDLVDWRDAATVKQRHVPSGFHDYGDRCIHVGGIRIEMLDGHESVP